MLVVGGESHPQDVSTTAEIFDLTRQMWINLKPLPRPMYGSPGVVDIGSRVNGETDHWRLLGQNDFSRHFCV